MKKSQIGVLLYHRVEELADDYNCQAIKPDNFVKQILYLKNNYEIITPNALVDESTKYDNKKKVIVTFDDGYYDFYYNVLPILKKYEVPATLFITTDNIDSAYENWTDNILRIIFNGKYENKPLSISDEKIEKKWNVNSKEDKLKCYSEIRTLFLNSNKEERDRYTGIMENWAKVTREGRESRRTLNSKEISALADEPLITIGCHTCSHPALKVLSKEEQWREIIDSKIKLEGIISRSVDYFSYPFGTKEQYSEITVDLIKKAGFRSAFTVSHELFDNSTSSYEIPRCPVGNYNENEFVNYMKKTLF